MRRGAYRILVSKLGHYDLQYVRRKALTLVNERNENVGHEEFDLLREITAHESKEVAKYVNHELVAVRKVTDEHDTLDS